VVKLARRRANPEEEVAIKVIHRRVLEANPSLVREIQLLRSLRHPHIIRLLEVFRTKDHLYLVMECARGPELFDRICETDNYSEQDVRNVVLQLLDALNYLHDQGIAHRDLKPENILFDSECADAIVKLVDFGTARGSDGAPNGMCTPVGTLGYKAPEIWAASSYDQAVDMWSLGVIVYIMLCGRFWGGGGGGLVWM
jgi:calcium/calmodulin-dependent protein kinase I